MNAGDSKVYVTTIKRREFVFSIVRKHHFDRLVLSLTLTVTFKGGKIHIFIIFLFNFHSYFIRNIKKLLFIYGFVCVLLFFLSFYIFYVLRRN